MSIWEIALGILLIALPIGFIVGEQHFHAWLLERDKKKEDRHNWSPPR